MRVLTSHDLTVRESWPHPRRVKYTTIQQLLGAHGEGLIEKHSYSDIMMLCNQQDTVNTLTKNSGKLAF